MSKEKRRVPKLRFPGFTEDWEQRKFGEIYERAGQKNDLTYGIDKIISVANMYFKKDVIVGSEEYLKTYNVFKLGDIAFEGHTNKEYRYGRFVENTIGDGIVSHIFDVFTPKINLDLNFWKDLIKYEPIMGPILRRCTKASRMMSNLTTKEFLEEQILCPTLEEQKFIGEFIVSLDKNITLHQRKLEHLNLKKKALLQKLFPKNGERYPELRFPGFTDAWEQRKLNDLVTIRRGLTYKPSDIAENGIRVLRSSNIDEDQFITSNDDVFVNIEAVNIPFAKNGDILITSANGSNRLVGKHTIISDIADNSAVHGGFMLLAESNNPLFTDALLSSNWYKRFINTYVAGGNGAIGNLSKSDLESQTVMIPSEHEQAKIGQWYDNINQLITLHQRKLEHLQLQKKALLQQMFV